MESSKKEFTKEEIEKIVGEEIETFSLESGCKIGDNVAGSLKSLKVKTKDKSQELDLVIKLLPEDLAARNYLLRFKVFWTENAFYKFVIPALKNMVSERVSHSFNCNWPFPDLISAFNDEESGSDYLCLKDVRASGYKMPDKFVGLTFPEMSLVMAELGKFHAMTYAFIKLEGEKFFEREEPGGYKMSLFKKSKKEKEEIMGEWKGMMDACFGLAEELVREKNEKLADKMKNIAKNPENFLQILARTSNDTDVKYFPAIIHGDFWLNNILIKYDEKTNAPVSVKFVDFQQARRGNIFEELQYFILTSSTPEFRKDFLFNVLSIYYDSFIGMLDILDLPSPSNFSLGFLIDSYYVSRIPAFLFLGFALPLQLGIGNRVQNGKPQEKDGSEHSELSKDEKVNSLTSEPDSPFGFNLEISPEMQVKMMIEGFRVSMKNSPKAIKRLLDVTQEMEDLKLI